MKPPARHRPRAAGLDNAICLAESMTRAMLRPALFALVIFSLPVAAACATEGPTIQGAIPQADTATPGTSGEVATPEPRYVWLGDGTLVNEALLLAGLATVDTYPPDVRYVESRYLPAQATARSEGRGIWAGAEEP
jgi:hypothetical protein